MERSHRVRYGLRFGLLLALAVGLAAWAAPPVGATGAEVRLEPSEVSAAVQDGPIQVTVKVDGVDHHFVDRGESSEGLGIFQFSLHFDPHIVAVMDVQPGPFLGSTGRGTSCFSQIRPEDESIFDFACSSQDPPANGPQGSGALAQLTLIPVSAGRTELTLEGELGGPLGSTGDDIAVKVENGVLTVTGSGPPPTPPATPRPRPGDGPTATTAPGGSSNVTGPGGDNVSNSGPTGNVKERGATRVPGAGGGWQTRQTRVWTLALAVVLAVVGAALMLSPRLWTRGEPFVPTLFKSLPIRRGRRPNKER